MVFDPNVHLAYQPPAKRHSMTDLGLDPSRALCDFAVTEPFRLLSDQGVKAVREEIFSDPVQRLCKFTSKRTPSVLRGATQQSQLLRELWYSREMTEAVSDAAGQRICPHPVEYEVAHTNLQDATSSAPVDDWHFDSLPFVVVVLLSDLSGATGGATVLRTGSGEELAVRIPQPGWAIVLQGQHVEHYAQRAVGITERTTMVSAYIDADWQTQDNSSLKASRTYSVQSELYHQWTAYRLDALATRAAAMQCNLAQGKAAGNGFDRDQVMNWCTALMSHLQRTVDELKVDEQKSAEPSPPPPPLRPKSPLPMGLASPNRQQAVI